MYLLKNYFLNITERHHKQIRYYYCEGKLLKFKYTSINVYGHIRHTYNSRCKYFKIKKQKHVQINVLILLLLLFQ